QSGTHQRGLGCTLAVTRHCRGHDRRVTQSMSELSEVRPARRELTPRPFGAEFNEFSAWLTRARVPGCAIAVTRAQAEPVVLSFGLAALDPPRPVDEQTQFHLFSGTKLYTATALMRLVDRGDVDLAAPMTHYLPELRLRYPISVLQLASHDSG